MQSSDAGTAYLVNTNLSVTNVASITSAADNQWNSVAVSSANTNTNLSAAGLADGLYRVYSVDSSGTLLSAASSNTVTVDTTAPAVTLAAGQHAGPGGNAVVRSSEVGTAYLVNSSVTVSSLANITGAADANWNSVSVSLASTDTNLSTTGLTPGTYKLYSVDTAGNLSAASSTTYTVDQPPTLSTISFTNSAGTYTMGDAVTVTAVASTAMNAGSVFTLHLANASNTVDKPITMTRDATDATKYVGTWNVGYDGTLNKVGSITFDDPSHIPANQSSSTTLATTIPSVSFPYMGVVPDSVADFTSSARMYYTSNGQVGQIMHEPYNANVWVFEYSFSGVYTNVNNVEVKNVTTGITYDFATANKSSGFRGNSIGANDLGTYSGFTGDGTVMSDSLMFYMKNATMHTNDSYQIYFGNTMVFSGQVI